MLSHPSISQSVCPWGPLMGKEGKHVSLSWLLLSANRRQG